MKNPAPAPARVSVSDLPFHPGSAPGNGRIVRVKLRSQDDVRALEDIPPEALLPGPTIYDCLRAAALENPEKPAIVDLVTANVKDACRVIGYGALLEQIRRAANLFMAA